MKYIIKLFSILFLIISCQSDKKQQNITNPPPLTIQVTMSDSSYTRLNDLLKMDSYIILSSEIALGEIKRYFIHDDLLYVLDTNNKIVCYDKDGAVVFKIDGKGRGPGEYIEITDFSIDKKDKRLKLYDSFSKMLSFYSSRNGTFISEKKLDIVPGAIASISESNYFYNPYNYNYPNSKKYHFSLLWSKSGTDINKKYLPHHPILADYHVGFGQGYPFFYNASDIYFTNRFENIVYTLKKDTIGAKYIIELPNEAPLSYLKKKPPFLELLQSKYSVGLSDIYECSNILYFTFNNSKYIISAFYDINEQEVIYCGRRVKPHPTKELPVYYPIGGVYEDKFFTLMPPAMIINQKKKDHGVLPSDFLKIKKQDNPVLIFYKVKK